MKFHTNNNYSFKNIFLTRCFILIAFLFFYLSSSSQTGNTLLGTDAGSSLTSGDNNTLIGDSCGISLGTGLNNVFIGQQSGFEAIGASNNVFIGQKAGHLNISNGTDNVFIGQQAGYSNLEGKDNVFLGKDAGYLSNASDNTFIGAFSGAVNTTGRDNSFFGEQSGFSNTTGLENTFLGEDSGYNNTSGNYNTYVGRSSGRTNTTGYRNTAVGTNAGYDFSNAHHCTAVGDSSGVDNGEGLYNTFLGAAAGPNNEHADYGTFVGAYAGFDNNRTNSTSNGNRNTYMGYRCGYTNRDGEDNVGLGSFSDFNGIVRSRCTFIGANSKPYNNDVIVFGYGALANKQFSMAIGNESSIQGSGIGIGHGVTMQNGSEGSTIIGNNSFAAAAADSSLAIGAFAEVHDYSSVVLGTKARAELGAFNSIAIGFNTVVSDSNSVVIGNPSTEDIGGAVNWTALSDGRFKSDVSQDVPGLAFIDLLRPVTYHINEEAIYNFQGIERSTQVEVAVSKKASTRYSGFIAQEVKAGANAIGYAFSGVKVPEDPEKGIYGLRYAEFVVPLVQAVQELHEIIHQQQDEITALTQKATEIDMLKAENKRMAADIEAIRSALGLQQGSMASKE